MVIDKDLYPFTGRVLDLDRLRYHYLDEGLTDRDEAVVMVHGNPTWSFYYRELVKALRGEHRVVVPDHIGCGLSDKPGKKAYDYTLARRVADLGVLITHLGLKQVTLVVHDWGGMIGTAWAAQHPDRVKRLVILNTAAFHLPGGKTFPGSLRLARLPGLGAFMVRGFNAFCRAANRLCVTRKPLAPAVARAYLAPYDSWAHRVAVHQFVVDIPLQPGDPAYDVVTTTQERLPALRDVEMLICWGMRDFVFDHHFLSEWEKHFPQAQVHRFEDCGHYILEDASEEVITLVQTFLRRSAVEAAS